MRSRRAGFTDDFLMVIMCERHQVRDVVRDGRSNLHALDGRYRARALSDPLSCSKFVQALRPLLDHLFEVYSDSVEADHSQQINLVFEPDVKGIRVL